jgi:hypothetical protein
MKLDTGMHIGLHLVFFGKAGVTFCVLILLRACMSTWEGALEVRGGRDGRPAPPPPTRQCSSGVTMAPMVPRTPGYVGCDWQAA